MATVHRLRVDLLGVDPPVWRRVEVPGAATLGDLREVLQRSRGWWDEHLHEFVVAGRSYRRDAGDGAVDEEEVVMADVAPAGTVIDYLYDFGDGWQHRIEVEEVRAAGPDDSGPRCTDGARACPPEDCGARSATPPCSPRWPTPTIPTTSRLSSGARATSPSTSSGPPSMRAWPVW